MNRTLGVLAAVATLAAAANPAAAQQCPAMQGASPALENTSTQARLDYIRARLGSEKAALRTWKLAWGLGIAGVGLVQLGLATVWDDEVDLKVITLDEDYRIDLYVGAIRSVIGSASMGVFPKPRIDLPPQTGDDCETLAAAEKALRDSASHVRAGHAPIKHAGVLALNTAVLLVLGLGYDRWQTALVGAGVAIAVGELIIFTQPMGAVGALEDYKAGTLGDGSTTSWHIVPSPIGQMGLGLSAVGSF